ncbi:MAG: type II toxin-antitoxin system VapC family toxin [Dermatophilaceae bacterium]
MGTSRAPSARDHPREDGCRPASALACCRPVRRGLSPVLAPAARGLLDTSVFIAAETGRTIDAEMLPDEAVICPVTVAELQAGVLAATDVDVRARRLATLESVADAEVLSIDGAVAAEWARLRVHLAEHDRRVNVNDLWIAATAAAHQIPVVTQDDDFGPLDGVRGLEIVRV